MELNIPISFSNDPPQVPFQSPFSTLYFHPVCA